MRSFTRLMAVMKKELRQLGRDRITFGMIVGMPIAQILMFGYAIDTDVRNLSAAVADQADTHLSRQFVAELGATQVLDIRYRVQTPQELEELLRSGEISVGVHLPSDFDRRSVDPRRAAAQILVDGSDPTILGVATQLLNMPLGFDLVKRQGAGGQLEVRAYYNPERRSAVNIIPGLIGVILTFTMLIFTAVAIVREREHGNLELLINTPITTTQLMVGKVTPYIGIGLLQLALIVGVSLLLFSVPIRGTLLDLYVAAAIFIAANLALGLFVSTVTKTQFQAMQVAIFLLLPSILLSGFMFPFDGMPLVAQYLGELLPNTHFIRLTRGIMLRQASLAELHREALILAAFAVTALVAAILRFSRRLD
ncbi:MAG: ABC transporter permease [Gammaproteobacteria bacterium]|nr:MAG: ABC transporter permease [Gammaproteobacteria bacterium]